MTQQQDSLIEINARLAKANSECETWLAARATEKYLEACSNVEALELERATIVKDALRKAQNDVFTGDGELSRLGVSSDRAKLMSALSIAFDGCRYYYGPYKYEKLESAVDYARLQRARAVGTPRKIPTPIPAMCNEPSDADRELMNSAGVIFAKGVYHFGEYRYDKLADALAYARLTRARDGEITVVRECTS